MTAVYTETIENRTPVLTDLPGFNLLDNKVTIFQNDNKVAVATSVLLTGTPWDKTTGDWQRIPGKRYYRWRTIGSYGFIRTKSGIAMPYHSMRGPRSNDHWRNRFPYMAADALSFNGDQADAYRHAMWETFGATKVQHLYPMMDTYQLINYPSIPLNLRRAFRETSTEAYAGMVFGQKRNTERLQAAVVNTDAYVVALAHQFRGLVSDEALLSFIENTHFDKEMEETFEVHNPLVRKIVEFLPREDRESILAKGLDAADLKRIMQLSRYASLSQNKYHMTSRFTNISEMKSWSEIYIFMYGSDVVTERSAINRVINSDWDDDEDLDDEDEE
jgi:hypothetical protein